jgi:signal recognition particle subunit SEC65
MIYTQNMANRLQDSAYRKHTVKEAIQSVQEIMKDLGFMMPLEALAHLAAGYDPRKGNPLLMWLRRKIEKQGWPKRFALSEKDTERLYAFVRTAVNFEDVALDVSLRAIEKLADFIYPKQKVIESTGMVGMVIEAPPKIARKAMKKIADKVGEIY